MNDAEVLGHAVVWTAAGGSFLVFGPYGLIIAPVIIYLWIRITR